MQTSVPELMDLSQGAGRASSSCTAPRRKQPGTFAANCLLARRLAERGVRFIQLYHRGWDQHGDLPDGIRTPVRGRRSARAAALVTDLKQRGLLDDTLVVWGGEFGRTTTRRASSPRPTTAATITRAASPIWLAGGGIKPGITYGATDDFGYNVANDRVHVHDLHATILHLLGIDHEKLTYRFQGRDFRLTDVHGNVVKPILA